MKDNNNIQTINHPSQDAAAFIRKVTEMAYQLASKEIVVASLNAYWSGFGSWKLEAQRGTEAVTNEKAIMEIAQGRDPERDFGPEVVRVLWDGRDGILSIDVSPTKFLCAPNHWKPEHSERFDRKDDKLFQFVLDYLIKRLGTTK
jgi:hypothetical protein